MHSELRTVIFPNMTTYKLLLLMKLKLHALN